MPGALSFRTTPEGSDTPTERMHIDRHGTVEISRSPSTTSGGYATLALWNLMP